MNNPSLTLFAKLVQRCCNVVISTLRGRSKFDVAVSTLHQRCYYISMIYCEVNLLSNVEAKLPQLYKFDVVVSTL